MGRNGFLALVALLTITAMPVRGQAPVAINVTSAITGNDATTGVPLGYLLGADFDGPRWSAAILGGRSDDRQGLLRAFDGALRFRLPLRNVAELHVEGSGFSAKWGAALPGGSLAVRTDSEPARPVRPTPTRGSALRMALSMGASQTGVWLGGGFTAGTHGPGREATVGAWRRIGRLALSWSATSGAVRGATDQMLVQPGTRRDSVWNDTLSIWNHFSNPTSDTTRVNEADVGTRARFTMQWAMGRVALHGDMSWSLGSVVDRALAAAVEATWAISPRAAVLAAWRGTGPSVELEAPRRFVLGMRLSPSALRPPRLPLGAGSGAWRTSVDTVAPGRYRLRILAPSARTMEFSGDVTEWKPIGLKRDATGEWSIVLSLKPGTYHVAVRADGGIWRAPPGMPQVADEFRGSSGLLVIP